MEALNPAPINSNNQMLLWGVDASCHLPLDHFTCNTSKTFSPLWYFQTPVSLYGCFSASCVWEEELKLIPSANCFKQCNKVKPRLVRQLHFPTTSPHRRDDSLAAAAAAWFYFQWQTWLKLSAITNKAHSELILRTHCKSGCTGGERVTTQRGTGFERFTPRKTNYLVWQMNIRVTELS